MSGSSSAAGFQFFDPESWSSVKKDQCGSWRDLRVIYAPAPSTGHFVFPLLLPSRQQLCEGRGHAQHACAQAAAARSSLGTQTAGWRGPELGQEGLAGLGWGMGKPRGDICWGALSQDSLGLLTTSLWVGNRQILFLTSVSSQVPDGLFFLPHSS